MKWLVHPLMYAWVQKLMYGWLLIDVCIGVHIGVRDTLYAPKHSLVLSLSLKPAGQTQRNEPGTFSQNPLHSWPLVGVSSHSFISATYRTNAVIHYYMLSHDVTHCPSWHTLSHAVTNCHKQSHAVTNCHMMSHIVPKNIAVFQKLYLVI